MRRIPRLLVLVCLTLSSAAQEDQVPRTLPVEVELSIDGVASTCSSCTEHAVVENPSKGVAEEREEALALKIVEPASCSLLPSCQTGKTSEENGDTETAGCVKFFPNRFFSSGAGQRFLPLYKKTRSLPEINQRVIQLIKSSKTDEEDSACFNELPSSISFFHVLKCGGTSIFRSFLKIPLQVPYTMNAFQYNEIEEQGIIDGIYQQQKPESATPSPVVAYLRDPVVRFLSALGEMLHQERRGEMLGACRSFLSDQMNHAKEPTNLQSATAKDVVVPARIKNARTMVECTLNMIKNGTKPQDDVPMYNFFDQHFLPQAFELKSRTYDYDIAVTLMDIFRLGGTLKDLLGDVENEHVHARQSRGKDYADGYILDEFILTPDMIHDICQIYAVDVHLLHAAGTTETWCDVDLDELRVAYEEAMEEVKGKQQELDRQQFAETMAKR